MEDNLSLMLGPFYLKVALEYSDDNCVSCRSLSSQYQTKAPVTPLLPCWLKCKASHYKEQKDFIFRIFALVLCYVMSKSTKWNIEMNG